MIPLISLPYLLRIHQNWLPPPLPALLSLTLMQALPPSLLSTRGVATLTSMQLYISASINGWDSNNMVDIYELGIKREIAKATGLNIIDMRQVISSTAFLQSDSQWLLLDVVSISAQLYFNHMTLVNIHVSTYRDNGLSCLCSSRTNKCACDHSKKLWILDLGASMHFTLNQSDFIKYQELTGFAQIPIWTASATIFVEEQGWILVPWEDSLKNFHIRATWYQTYIQ